jgi:hypothetical protein
VDVLVSAAGIRKTDETLTSLCLHFVALNSWRGQPVGSQDPADLRRVRSVKVTAPAEWCEQVQEAAVDEDTHVVLSWRGPSWGLDWGI